jgi:hypothetical protein
VTRRSGRWQIVLRALRDGSEQVVNVSDTHPHAMLSPDGRHVAWSIAGNRSWPIYVRTLGSETKVVCEECGELGQWHPNSSGVFLTTLGASESIRFLNIETGTIRTVVNLPGGNLHSPRLSRDGRWLAFGISGPELRVCVTEFISRSVSAVPNSACISGAVQAEWSPSANRLYFISNADRGSCIHTQDVLHGKIIEGQHGKLSCSPAGWSILGSNLGGPQFAVGLHSIFVALAEHRANIWLTRLALN